MASRRQKLSQRRKAVGLTQESLAEHLGVERSTVIRWEAGDSQPLPSIRPNLARALQVSIDQLAELLVGSEDAGTARTPAADPEVTAPVRPAEVQLQRRPGGPESDELVHPQVAETVEALRRALRSAGVSAEDLAAMLLIGGSSRVPLGAPDVPVEPGDPAGKSAGSAQPHIEEPTPPGPAPLSPDVAAADVQRSRASSRRYKRLTVVGLFVLALPAAWLSAPFVFSQGGSGLRTGAATPQAAGPVVAIPAPNPGSAGSTVDTAPTVTPPVDGPAPPAAAAAPPAQTNVTRSSRTVSRSTRSAAKKRPAARRAPEWEIPAAFEDDRWNRLDRLERLDHLW